MAGLLDGLRILVVDDEFLAAMELAQMIENLGGDVVGPVGRLEEARELAREQDLDGAVLDMKLDQETSLPLAEDLMARDVPVIMATGYERAILPGRLADTPRLSKPYDDDLFERLAGSHFLRH